MKPYTVKKRYRVSLVAEGAAGGEIWLTEKQAAIVAFVTNPDNWKNLDDDGYSGSFRIVDAELEEGFQIHETVSPYEFQKAAHDLQEMGRRLVE